MKTCVVCGCTDDAACADGCWWASDDPPICAACVNREDDAPAERDSRYCPASQTPAAHKPIWTSEIGGHCAACQQPFFAHEAA